MFKKTLILFVFSTQLLAAPQGSQGSITSSQLSGQGIGNIVNGSSQILRGGSELSIAAIETVGEFTILTLKNAGNSATVTLRVASSISGHVLYGLGQMVQVLSIGTGQILTTTGHVIAFLPNEMGKSLMYSGV